MAKKRKDIVITMGDPAGCGPQIVLKSISALINKPINFWLVGDRAVVETFSEYSKIKNKINFIDLGTKGIKKIKKGSISKPAGRASLMYLERALELLKENNFNRLVTAPVSKEAIGLIKPGFCGHTEFLRDYFRAKKTAMLMTASKLRVILLTRHLLIREVPAAINKKIVLDTISLTYTFLKESMGISDPAIALAACNPHAGTETFMEKEEKVMAKAIAQFKGKIYGPHPPDSLFTEENLSRFDCIIAAYHDQGMIPFKLLAFHQGVNVTLGLPVIRTSPAHGVAFGLVKNKPENIFHTSMQAAIIQAASLKT